ncbi:MAG: PAS domain S-box protein [Deltaproteobacteria bacterium]|nr:PAS domain S-box protein [Deltaproteobacteria bacterium]
MNEQVRTNPELIEENALLKHRIQELAQSESERKQVEEALRKSEANYRQLFDNSPTGIYQIDFRTGKFSKANDAFCEYLGYSQKEITSLTPYDILTKESQEYFLERLNKMALGDKVPEYPEFEIISRNGKRRWVQLNTKNIYGSEGLVGADVVAHDITDRKRAEEALQRAHDELEQRVADRTKELMLVNEELRTEITERRRAEEALQQAHSNLERMVEERTSELLTRNRQLKEEIEKHRRTEESLKASEEKYRSVVENIGIGISLISPNMEILTLNNQMKKWYLNIDVSKRPICYKAFNDPPRDAVCSHCPTYKTLQDGQVHESVTETSAGTEIKNFRIISTPIKDMNGKIVAAIEMVEDITESKKMQEALRESEQKLSDIIDFLPDATFAVDLNGKVIAWNRAIEEMTGVKAPDILGKGDYEYALPFYGIRRPIMIDLVFISTEEIEKKYHFIKKEGDVLLAEADVPVKGVPHVLWGKASPLYNSSGNVVGAIESIRDITVRKRAEEALKKRERDLKAKSRNLEELNTALKVLLRQREEDKDELEEKILANVKQLAMPYIEKLKKSRLKDEEADYVNILESNLKNIISPFSHNLSSQYLNLTPKEIQIANLIKEGKTTKDIAELMNISPGTVDFHRDNIRVKLNLKNKKTNLRSYLMTLS